MREAQSAESQKVSWLNGRKTSPVVWGRDEVGCEVGAPTESPPPT